MSDVTRILLAAQSEDATQRRAAEEQLRIAEQANFAVYLGTLAAELQGADKPVQTRMLAGLLMKNCFFAKDEALLQQQQTRWINLDPNSKQQVYVFQANCLLSPAERPVFGYTECQPL